MYFHLAHQTSNTQCVLVYYYSRRREVKHPTQLGTSYYQAALAQPTQNTEPLVTNLPHSHNIVSATYHCISVVLYLLRHCMGLYGATRERGKHGKADDRAGHRRPQPCKAGVAESGFLFV